MAGVKPFFLTGANAKIKVNGKTLAFCTNLSYSVKVNTIAPQVLGMYEGSSVEPLSYSVSGQFSVIRYVADAKDVIKGTLPPGTNEKGNGIGAWGDDTTKGFKSLADGRAFENLNPRKLKYATTFVMEVYQKTSNGNVSVARIRDIRITGADFNLSKAAAATQTFTFTALYADEDSFLADFSGSGQQFA